MTDDQDPWTAAREIDQQVRIAAFEFLRSQTELRGEVLPRGLLAEGFRFDGQRVPLIGPQGIFKPAVLPEMPLTITTVPVIEGRERPYADEMDENGLLFYRYRGTDSSHRDNAGLRLAMRRAVPLIYLFGVVRGEYMPVWPVFIVGDHPETLAFSVAVDLKDTALLETGRLDSNLSEARRAYVTRVTQQRLHQAGFRVRVIRAYQERCAVCRLRHFELLDAAHILPDRHPKGDPTVSNGLALCKLHHAAFDGNILGVRPDLIVEIREDILREKDGPMLVHGLQGFQGARILIPTRRDLQPDRDFPARTIRERLQPPLRSFPPNAASALLCDAPWHRRRRASLPRRKISVADKLPSRLSGFDTVKLALLSVASPCFGWVPTNSPGSPNATRSSGRRSEAAHRRGARHRLQIEPARDAKTSLKEKSLRIPGRFTCLGSGNLAII